MGKASAAQLHSLVGDMVKIGTAAEKLAPTLSWGEGVPVQSPTLPSFLWMGIRSIVSQQYRIV